MDPADVLRDLKTLPNLPAELSRLLPIMIGFVAGVAAMLLAPTEASREFYEICAQVIPVLLLAVALEARLLRAQPSGRADVDRLITACDAMLADLEERENALATRTDVPLEETLAMQREIAGSQRTFRNHKSSAARLKRNYLLLRVLYLATAVGFLLYGEIIALDTLAQQSYQTTTSAPVFGVVVFGFVAVLVAAVQGPVGTPHSE